MMDLFPIAARSAANALSNEAYQKLLTSEAETLLSSAGMSGFGQISGRADRGHYGRCWFAMKI